MIPQQRASALPARPAAATASASASSSASNQQTYKVRPGDTLSSIARHFDMTVTDLKRINQLSSDNIVVGDKLTVRK
jgi:LysM repeat protein